MNINIKNIHQEIRKGKQLQENIPVMLNYLANQYHTYAGIRLAMHYYSFYEAYCDDEELWSEEAKSSMIMLNAFIRNSILNRQGGSEIMESVEALDQLRTDIIKRMEVLTSYTDIFQNYEYVLNRIEPRFSDHREAVDEVEFSKEILRYIFDSQDNFIINEKIREIIGQLPVRMTKQKYFDILKDSIYAYEGAEQSTLDSYLYMIRTSAMLGPDEKFKTCYPRLWEKKSYLEGLHYKDISKEEFEEAQKALQVSTLLLETETSVFMSMQEIVNEVYAILLCKSYTGMVDAKIQKLEDTAQEIIGQISHLFQSDEKTEIPEEVMNHFSVFEGVQEELSYDLVLLEESLYELEQNNAGLVKSLMLDSLLNSLLRVKDLLSTSLFIDWKEDRKTEIAGEKSLQESVQVLMEELSRLFSAADKAVVRAVMANTLNKMPVFFKSHTEVMEYVRCSLEHCTNSYEKTACIEIVREIMSE